MDELPKTIDLNWKVAGLAGEGIMTTGLLLSKSCSRAGLNIFDYTEYPSLIRGGHNTYQVHASNEPVYAQRRILDVLVALNRDALAFHKDELSDKSIVLYDKDDDKVEIGEYGLPGPMFDLPMVRLATEAGGTRLIGNNVGLGASMFFLGLDIAHLFSVIEEVFGKKGDEVVGQNKKAAQAGYDFAKNSDKPLYSWQPVAGYNKLTLTGNEAIGLGVIAGGLKFYAAYPMTPSSSLLHYLAKNATKADIVVKHAEDEIGVINMALGASFTGVRSMVGTSGGGFSYMTEALGMSGVAEIPLVVFESMRPGPALGMPTWTAQADLQYILFASQDEFPRFVLIPGDAKEAFDLSKKSLELAEKYQTLVMLVSDKFLSESRHTMDKVEDVHSNDRYELAQSPVPDDSKFYPRYRDNENGIGKRSLPGQPGGMFITNSYEHDDYGLASEEASVRKTQMDKRFKKWDLMMKEVPAQMYVGGEGKVTIISFGSTKGPVLAAMKLLEAEGIKINFLHLSWLWPFPAEQVEKVIKTSARVVVVEGNRQGQLARLIAQETGIKLSEYIRKYDGRPFYGEDIANEIKQMLNDQ